MIELTLWAAIALTILVTMKRIYGTFEATKMGALIFCAGIAAIWAIWSGLDVEPFICQLVLLYLLYACASIVWTPNKRIAVEALLRKACFILFFLIAYNAKPEFKVVTLWIFAGSAAISAFWALYKWFIKSRYDKRPYVKHRKAYGTIGNVWKASAIYLPAFFVALYLAKIHHQGGRILALVIALLLFATVIHSRTRAAIIGIFVSCAYLICS